MRGEWDKSASASYCRMGVGVIDAAEDDVAAEEEAARGVEDTEEAD